MRDRDAAGDFFVLELDVAPLLGDLSPACGDQGGNHVLALHMCIYTHQSPLSNWKPPKTFIGAVIASGAKQSIAAKRLTLRHFMDCFVACGSSQ
jgi:hypothetical protein